VENLGTALLASGFAGAFALWVYGVYCYVQMVRHRTPGAHLFQVAWPSDQLTQPGREFRRRALRAYAYFAVLVLALLLISVLFSAGIERVSRIGIDRVPLPP
jgi:hypothetical protein